MFYAIHRAIKYLLIALALLVAWQLFQHRRVAEPLVIWFKVWENGGFREKPMPGTTGVAEKVVNSQTFILRTTNNAARMNVRLLGLEEPSKQLTTDALHQENKRRKALEDLIKGKEVRLLISYQNLNNLGGIVFVGPTNINAHLVQERLAFTDQKLVKGFPKDVQFQMLWSQRRANTNK